MLKYYVLENFIVLISK